MLWFKVFICRYKFLLLFQFEIFSSPNHVQLLRRRGTFKDNPRRNKKKSICLCSSMMSSLGNGINVSFCVFYCCICIFHFYHHTQKTNCVTLIILLCRLLLHVPQMANCDRKTNTQLNFLLNQISAYIRFQRLTKLSTNDQRFNVNCNNIFFLL